MVRNSDAYISNGEKIYPNNMFSWIDDSYKLGKDKFQFKYQFLGLIFIIWHHLREELQLCILLYLNAKDLITLFYVSKYFRKLVLKQFNNHYEISTGFFCCRILGKKKLRKMFFN